MVCGKWVIWRFLDNDWYRYLGYPKVLETLVIVILARLLRFGIDQIFIKIVGYHHFARTVVILN
jgi:hypothetical protein